jgi:LacI family transcriptional regulator
MASNERVTIQDIGKKLNISASTVSRALRQDPLIHPQTRAQVNALAMSMGYQGRSRRGPKLGKKTASIAVFFSVTSFAQVRNGIITTAYLEGLTSEAEAMGASLGIYTAGGASGKELPSGLQSAKYDAVIIIGKHDQEMVEALTKRASVISMVRHYPGVNIDRVCTDDIQGMAQVVQHLADLGHRKLAWIGVGGPENIRGSHQQTREAGFLLGCINAGLTISEQVLFEDTFFHDDEVAEPKALLHKLEEGVTAIVCATDYLAELVLHKLESLGVNVPADVSVTGFDGAWRDVNGANAVTSVNPHFVEMGRSAIRLAVWRLEQPFATPVTLTMSGALLPGPSTAAPRGEDAKPASGKGKKAKA